MRLHTGLSSYNLFSWLFKRVEEKAKKFHYYKGAQSDKIKRHQVSAENQKPGRKRSLPLQDHLLITLMKLKQGLTEEDLSFRFKISQSACSQILSTWIPFLGLELEPFLYWPTQSEIQNYYPDCFSEYPNVRAILDCTEVFIERPSLAEAQAKTCSNYKSKNTWKTLVAATPAGTVSFVSRGHGGKASDRKIVEESGILDKFEHGDSCMVDRGFNIQDLLLSRGTILHMPPFSKGTRFTPTKENKTNGIAGARIHVERAIGRIKNFRILKTEIPLSMVDLLYHIVAICAALTNLLPPLVPLRRKSATK